jgi:hypothetical protein
VRAHIDQAVGFTRRQDIELVLDRKALVPYVGGATPIAKVGESERTATTVERAGKSDDEGKRTGDAAGDCAPRMRGT